MEDPRSLTTRGIRIWSATLRSLVALVLLSVGIALTAKAKSSTNEPAQVKISGFGFLGDRELVRLLRNFQVDNEMPPVVTRDFVEDAALVLLARANSDGFLNAVLHGEFKMLDGSRQMYNWTNVLDVALPRDFAAAEARFKLKRGERFHYEDIRFSGLEVFSRSETESYFVNHDMLLKLERNRVYNPATLNSSLAALREAYARAGYQDAMVTTNSVTMDESNGEVAVEIAVQEGRRTVVHKVEVMIYAHDQEAPVDQRILTPDEPFSHLWQQELAQNLQTEQYAKGYPDAAVTFIVVNRQTNATDIQMDLAANVQRGPLIHLGKVELHGNKRTKTSVLESRIRLEEGEPLNRIEAELSRQRLARLGVFDSVGLRYENVDETNRNVIYNIDESKPLSLSLLGGFGSYELLRGGLEFQHRNFLGRAHNLRLRGSQSFKSSKADLNYTVPEVFGENVNLFLQASGLRREEVSFTREEYGGSVGIQKRLVPIKTDFSLRYDYEFLNALDLDSTSTNLTGVQEAKAASFVIELNHDQRDHPLLPRRGLKLFSRMEFATAALGGDVDYQRLILGASYHLDLDGGRLLHLGVTHGVSFTFGGSDDDLPFNKRFFPGGEHSVRGFQEGKASPLDENGDQLGAETYTQANVEFEQILTKSWSVVAFFDAVGFAQRRADYPWNEGLYSVGGGLRWRTIIGPVRLEYGHNLNPRSHDPSGTLHFSIGIPF